MESGYTREILDGIIGIYIYIIEKDTCNILYYNEVLKEKFPSLEAGMKCYEVFENLDMKCTNCPVHGMEGKKTNTVIMYNDPFGSIVDVTSTPMKWKDGSDAYIITITPHVVTEEEQEKRLFELKYSMALRGSCEYILEIDIHTGRYTGYIPDGRSKFQLPCQGNYNEEIRRFAKKYIREEEREGYLSGALLENILERIKQTGKELVIEFCFYDVQGRPCYLQRTNALVKIGKDGKEYLIAYAKDMTDVLEEQKKQEKELSRYTNAIGALYDEIIEVNLTTGSYYVLKSDKVYPCPLRGNNYEEENERYKNVLIHPNDQVLFDKYFSIQCMKERIAAGEKEIHQDLRRLAAGGKYEWGQMTVLSLESDQGKDIRVLCTYRNIQKLKEAENRQKLSSAQLNMVMRNSYSEVYVANLNTDGMYYLDYHENGYEKYNIHKGYKKTFQFILNERIHPEDKKKFRVLSADTLKQMQENGEKELYIECRRWEPDKQYHWNSYLIQLINDGVFLHAYFFVKNLDKLKNLEHSRTKLEEIISKIVKEDYRFIGLINVPADSYILFASQKEKVSLPEHGKYSKEMLEGGVKDVYEEDRTTFMREMEPKFVQHVLEEKNEYVVSYRILNEDGSFLYINAIFTYSGDDKNYILLRTKDITEQVLRQRVEIERAKKEEGRFKFLLRNMCENFMEVEVKNHKSTLTKPKEGKVQRGKFEDQIMEFADTVVLPEERDAYLKEFDIDNLIYNIEENNGLYSTNCNVCYEDGRHCLLITSTLMDGAYGKKYIFLFAQDITELIKKEEQSKLAIMEALDLAKQASRAKSEFLSRMSHEIRTPLNAIIGFITLIKLVYHSPEKIREYVEKMETSSYYLLSLINDILDMSRIESGKMSIAHESFSLRQLMNKIKILFTPQAEEKNIHFSVEENITYEWLFGDALRLNQVLANLLSNAVKFTEPGGYITLTVKETKGENNKAVLNLAVKDTGIGIKKENLEKIFDTFEQAEDNTSNQYGGTGLGLSISRRIVNLMGGELKVKSEYTKGSEFYFSLCLEISDEKEPVQEEKEPCTEEARFDGKRFLLVEDNELNLEIASELLEVAGAKIEYALNGQESVDMFLKSDQGYYDLILMDIQMPVMNGLEATRIIRKSTHPDAACIPIVGMSANAFGEDIKRAMDAGMDAYTAKPININEVYEIINRMIIKKDKGSRD